MLIKKLFCKHSNIVWIRNIYGDEINLISSSFKTFRSIWKCKDCNKIILKEKLK